MNAKIPDWIEQNVELAHFTTMRVGGECDYFATCHTVDQVKEACELANQLDLPIFVLGEGSNVIVTDAPVHRMVLRISIPGYEVTREDADHAWISVGAGEHWDGVVERSVEAGLAGIEAMSMIPGTTGATPVQNAGAYGQEIADTLVEVEAYDLRDRAMVTLTRDECGFGYRSSAFKGALAGRYVITGVVLKLRKGAPKPPTYASLKRYLAHHDIEDPTVAQIRTAVMSIRARILPDPSVVPNTGSFFKNPIVDQRTLDRLRGRYPEMPAFEYDDGYKLAAGWLMDQCGLKGAEKFGLKLHDQHALVITNPNHASYADLEKLVKFVVAEVRRKFDVTLEPEPQFVRGD